MHQRFGLLVNRDFRQLFASTTVSQSGFHLAQLAMSLVAIDHLGADAFQAGLVVTLQFAGYFVVGLPAGAWVDRWRRRSVLIVTDLGRAVLLGTVPIAWWAGVLTLTQLYAVAFAYGIMTVFFEAAYQAYLPHLVGRSNLVEANAKLEAMRATAQATAPAVAGYLVRIITAPIVLLVDAFAMAGSVVFYLRIQRREEAPERDEGSRLTDEIRQGLRFVLKSPLLRPIVLCTGTFNLFFAMYMAVLVYFLRQELGAGPAMIGIVLSTTGIGAVCGSVIAGRVGARLGPGRAMWMSTAFSTPFLLAVPLARIDWHLWIAACASAVAAAGGIVYKVTSVSFRQAMTPDGLLGRMNATSRFLVWGFMPVGGGLGSWFGNLLGTRTTVLIAVVGMSSSFLPILLSRVGRLREVPEPSEAALVEE